MAPAVRRCWKQSRPSIVGKASADGAREGDLKDTVELFYDKGYYRLFPVLKNFNAGL